MNYPLLSIVIPTRNRIQICIKTIETILKINDYDFELIIHDNSDSNGLEQYLNKNINDERLVFHRSTLTLSFVENFNLALSFAKGYYVTSIGDDDGVNPEIINVARFAKKNDIESLGSLSTGEYYWPNVIQEYKNGCLIIPSFTGKISTYDPGKRLIPLLMSGIVNYIPFNLPRFYHGMVKRELFEILKRGENKYFRGLSPDIYSTIALSTIVKRHTLIDYPFTISGVCNASGAAASDNGKHCGKLEDAPHFRGNSNYNWEPEIPKYYSVETIWAETALKALKDHNRLDLIKYFNPVFLVAQSILKNPSIRKLIFDQCMIKSETDQKSFLLFKLQVFIILLFLRIRIIFNQTYGGFIRKKDTHVRYLDIFDIEQATALFEKNIQKNNIRIETLPFI